MTSLESFVSTVSHIQDSLEKIQGNLDDYDGYCNLQAIYNGAFQEMSHFRLGSVSGHEAMSLQQDILPCKDLIEKSWDGFHDILKGIYDANEERFRAKKENIILTIGRGVNHEDVRVYLQFPLFLFQDPKTQKSYKPTSMTIIYRNFEWRQRGQHDIDTLLSCEQDLDEQKLWEMEPANPYPRGVSPIRVVAKNEKIAMGFARMEARNLSYTLGVNIIPISIKHLHDI